MQHILACRTGKMGKVPAAETETDYVAYIDGNILLSYIVELAKVGSHV